MDNPAGTTLPQVIERFRRQERARRSTESTFALAVLTGLSMAGLIVADWLFHLPAVARLLLLAGSAITVGSAAIYLILHALRSPSDVQLAEHIEQRSNIDFENCLVTAVEFQDPVQIARFGYSAGLVEACRNRAGQLAADLDLSVLSSFERVRQLLVCTMALGLMAAALVTAKGDLPASILLYRYLALAGLIREAPVQFDVKPGDAILLEGERLELTVAVTGKNPPREAPALDLWEESNSHPQKIQLSATDNTGTYSALFPRLAKSFRYRVSAGAFETRTFSVQVIPPPRVAAMTLRYRYPTYTRLKEHRQERAPYDIAAPVGTMIDCAVNSFEPITAARLVLPDGPVSLAQSRATTQWEASFAVKSNGQYFVELTDGHGYKTPSPEHFQILAVPDRVPSVLLLEPGRDLSSKPQDLTTVPIKIEISDDYGVRQVTLKYKLIQKVEYNYMTTDESKVLAAPADAPQKMSLDFTWDLRQRVLQAGDSIVYYVEASDHFPGAKGVPDPNHVGVSKTYYIRVPITTEVLTKAAEEEENQINTLEDVTNRQRALEEKVDKVLKDIRNSRDVGYKEKKELEQIVGRQKEIKDKAQEVANRMKDTVATLQKNDMVDPGTIQKLAEIQQLFGEVADSKLKENMERMRELVQGMKMDPDQMQKMLQSFDKNRYSKELERILKSLKRLKQQQDLAKAISKTDEIIKKQEDLRSQTAGRMPQKQPTADLAKQQEELQREAEKLVKNLPDLAKELTPEFPDTGEKLDSLSKENQNNGAPKDMDDAAKSLKSNQGSKAYGEQSNALNKMQKMGAQMRQAQSGMKQKQMEVNLQAMIAMVDLGIRVSSHEQLLDEEAQNNRSAPDMRKICLELARRQYTALRGITRFEKDFEQGFPDEVGFKNLFLSQIAQLLEDMEDAKKNYEDVRLFSAKQLSERCLMRLNVILAKLMDVLGQMQDQQGAQSMDSFFDQMQKMIEQQRRINEKTARLKPNEAMNPFMQQMMQQMSLEQEMVRKSMEELARKYEKAKNLLGNLDDLSQDMKSVEEALKKFDRTAATREKQERVLNRMLEYSKSAKKQGNSEMREAEIAKTYAPAKVSAVPADMNEVRQKLFENLSRETYPPQHKKVVEDYFSSFSQ